MKKILSFILALLVSLSAVLTYSPLYLYASYTPPPYTYFYTPPETDPETGENSRVSFILSSLQYSFPDIVSGTYAVIVYFQPPTSSHIAYYGATVFQLDNMGTPGALSWQNTFNFSSGTIFNYLLNHDSDPFSGWKSIGAIPVRFWDDADGQWKVSSSYSTVPILSVSSKGTVVHYRTNLGADWNETCTFTTSAVGSTFLDAYNSQHPNNLLPPASLLYFYSKLAPETLPSDIPISTGLFDFDNSFPVVTSPSVTEPPVVTQPPQQTLPADWFEDTTVEEPEEIDVSNVPSPSTLLDSLNSLKKIATDGLTSFADGIRFWLNSFDTFLNYFPWIKSLILVIFVFCCLIYVSWRL